MSNNEQQGERALESPPEKLRPAADQSGTDGAQAGQDLAVPFHALLPERFSGWRVVAMVATDGVVLVDRRPGARHAASEAKVPRS